MTTIHDACNRVNLYATNDGIALAMHKVSKETGYTKSALAKEFAERRKAKRKRKAYKSTVPDWVLNSKEWD